MNQSERIHYVFDVVLFQVERLVERVNSSTLLDDRRDACRALKALSRKYRIEVGAQGMSALIQVLQMDRADCEIISYALDTLCQIVTPEQFDEEADNPTVSVNVGEQFTEMFLKNSENVTLVLGYLEEYDFRVRWSAIKLLTTLLANKTKDIQEIVLVSPMAVSKLMDFLIDSREVIRNDALLLLIQLTKGKWCAHYIRICKELRIIFAGDRVRIPQKSEISGNNFEGMILD